MLPKFQAVGFQSVPSFTVLPEQASQNGLIDAGRKIQAERRGPKDAGVRLFAGLGCRGIFGGLFGDRAKLCQEGIDVFGAFFQLERHL